MRIYIQAVSYMQLVCDKGLKAFFLCKNQVHPHHCQIFCPFIPRIQFCPVLLGGNQQICSQRYGPILNPAKI